MKIIEADTERGKKKRLERKQGHAKETMSQNYTQQLSKISDCTIVERKSKPGKKNDVDRCRTVDPT